MDEMTAFGGTLIRWAKNTWAWSDNSPAPNVRDMTASEYYNFRVRANQWVEVIVHAVREDEDLRWVMEGNYDISLSTDQYGEKVIHEDGRITRASQTGKVIPEVYLVPIADWDAHDECVGAQWPDQDHDAIFSKARSLGFAA